MRACQLTILGIHACDQGSQLLDLFLKLKYKENILHMLKNAVNSTT